MGKILFIGILLFFVACSHHHNTTEHHHHQFDRKCAYEVGQNHFDVAGKEEFRLVHDGEVYYFSSQEKLDKFQADLPANIERSKKNWRVGPPSSRKN